LPQAIASASSVSVVSVKHLDKLKSSGVLQIENRGEVAKKIRELMFGKYARILLQSLRGPRGGKTGHRLLISPQDDFTD
jgi:hypothetical protein